MVKQSKINSLKDFVEKQNNFYAYFLKGNDWGEIRREKEHFKKFQENYPELENEVTEKTLQAFKTGLSKSEYPLEKLMEAYNIMVDFVPESVSDKYSLTR